MAKRGPVRTTKPWVPPAWAPGAFAAAIAILLTGIFWAPLWNGASFVGGDTYPYFYPQKTFLSDQLRQGTFPLWNNLVGEGYPLLAESQTGVLYPPHLILYRLFETQTAYNLSHLLHAVAAFLGTWLLARRLGLSPSGALFCGLVFVYGWFPARACLEWAIIGGAYFPFLLWSAESWLQQRRLRWLVTIAILLAVFLFAGHFHLAFITLLAVVGYALLRPALVPEVEAPASTPPPASAPNAWRDRLLTSSGLLAAIAVGFLLAAVQILPTLELRERSQRFDFSSEHNPLYGRIPVPYLSHIAAPWMWFNDETNPDTVLGGSNRVEAHLYCGLIPLALALWVAWTHFRERRWTVVTAWLVLGVVFLALATGEPLVWLKALPGFSFFRGAGRYGMVTAFSIALASGMGIDRLLAGRSLGTATVVLTLLMGVTAYDLYRVVPYVSYVVTVPSPLQYRNKSEVREILRRTPQARVFGPGQNVLTILGVSQLPVYLGIGPAEYFSPKLNPPKLPEDRAPTDEEIAEHVRWFRESGITHVLGQKRWDSSRWPLKLVWQGFDEFLNRAWGQFDKPLYLYELADATGRLELREGAQGAARIAKYEADRVTLECDLASPGQVVLKDLAYPGWTVTVDGEPSTAEVALERFRAVEVPAGVHTVEWLYRPRSVYRGGILSAATAFGGLLALGIVRLKRRAVISESH